MERRAFGYLAALAVLPGCSGTVTDGLSGGARADDGKTGRGGIEVPGLDSDGIADVEAFLDAQRAAAAETSHAVAFTQTADGTFEDGHEALELRAQADPSTGRLRVRRWRRHPDGSRRGEIELYTDGSGGGRRTVVGEEVRLDAIPGAAIRQRYTSFREDARTLLAALRYGSVETAADADAEYRLPVTGVRDVETASLVESVGSGHLSLTERGLLRAFELGDLVEARVPDRSTDLRFEVTDVGETSVSEPDWFGRVDGTTDGDAEDSDASGEPATVLVGPGGNLVFEPETLRVEPGTTVEWVWRSDTHNVEPTDQPAGADWDGHPDIANDGTTYEYTFDVEGEYAYACAPHASIGMEGSIVVESQ